MSGRRRLHLLSVPVLSLGLVLGAAACSDDDDGPSGPTSAPSIIPAVTVTSSTSADPTATTAPPAPTGAPEAAQAAQVLYDAWTRDDRATAATVAEPPAIEAVWAATPGPYQLYRGCDTGEFDTGGCLFRDRSTNNTIQVEVSRRDGVWVVTGAFFSPG